jgi:hypothetical protein
MAWKCNRYPMTLRIYKRMSANWLMHRSITLNVFEGLKQNFVLDFIKVLKRQIGESTTVMSEMKKNVD